MYQKSVTRSARALFVIAIDQSGSMAGMITVGGVKMTKAKMVAEVANDLISELVERSRRAEGIRDYYDVAVIGYSGAGVESLLGADFVSISELDKNCPNESILEREYRLESGEVRFFRQRSRRWIADKASGATPMYEAHLYINELTERWCSNPENYESHPPMIFNITDGESTDCNYNDMAEIAARIKSISTYDGNALLFNIHIASAADATSLLFPSLEEFTAKSPRSQCAQSLFHTASDIPQELHDAVCQIKGSRDRGQLKAMSFNSKVSEIISILNVGSISIKVQ